VRILSTRRDENSDECATDQGEEFLISVYFEEEPGRRAAAHLLTRDEARRIAVILPSCPTCSAGAHRWRSSVDSTVRPSAKLPHTMMDVAMMAPPVSVTIRRDCGSSSQRLAG
jgi:hypothetical protein